jgi:hypothetical protein
VRRAYCSSGILEINDAQWEYEKIDLNDTPRKSNEIDVLNDAGQDGWELVSLTPNNMAILKREVAQPAPAKSPSRRAATSRALAK